MVERPVYLDYQATTPLDPRVSTAIVEAFSVFGNPHGRQHSFGRTAADIVDSARAQIATLIGSYPGQIIFTSGATESCNLALRGVARKALPRRRKIITLATEHAAVLETVVDLNRQGFNTIILPVKSNGIVDLNRLDDAVDDSTLIVSVMAVNNEIGVIQPLAEIASICRRHGAFFHTDATQAPARIETNVEAWGVDLLSISAHKIYGPKGIGALYVENDAVICPILSGGGQERGLRSGTVPTALACGFGVAAEIATDERSTDAKRMAQLAGYLRREIDATQADVHYFGAEHHRAPGTLSFGYQGLSGDKLVAMVAAEIAISTGSACASRTASVSHVLMALGCSRATASTGVRIGLGRFTTTEEIKLALNAITRAADMSM